jgi:MYXO-CTERM domain-containing protein
MRCWLIALVAASSSDAFAQRPVTNALPDAGDPAVIALVNGSDQLVCTAAVIAPHTALTAAHCVAGDPLALRAFFGSALAEGGTAIAVTDARAHPLFDPGGNDIALVTLADPAPATPLPIAGPLDASLVDTSFRVVGFGTVGPTGGAGIKRAGTAKIASLGAEDFIAVPDLSLSCLGDSGGPALLVGDAIAGVVSRVDAQCIDHAIYTRVDVALDVLIQPYLDETAPGAAADGEPCFYDGHCAAGLECRGDAQRVCEGTDGGCGCQGGEPSAPGALAIVLALAMPLRWRRGRCSREDRR